MELLLKEGKIFEDYTISFRQHILPYLNLFEKEVKRLKDENQDKKISEDIYSAESVSDFVFKCSRYMQEPIRQLEYSYVLKKCIPSIFEKSVLDVGCGISPLPRALTQNGAKVSGIDKISEIIDYLNDKRTLLYDPRIKYFAGDITVLNVPDSSFDYVVCVSVLEHLPSSDDTKALKEMLRIVKPGGKVIVTVDFTPTDAQNNPEKQDEHNHIDFSILDRKTKSGLKLLRQRKIGELGKKLIRKNTKKDATGAYTLKKFYQQLIDPFEEYFFEEKPTKIELTLNDIRRFYASTWFESCMYKKDELKNNVSIGFTLEKNYNI